MIRRKVHTIVLLAVFAVMLASCGGHSYPHQLAVADSLCETNPDSAVRYLRALRPHFDEAQKDVRMYYRLLCINAMDKAYVPQKSDKEILQIVDYYEHGGDKNLLPMAYYNAGCVYFYMNDAQQSLAYFQKVVDCIGDDTKQFHLKGLAYGMMEYIFIDQDLYDESLNMNMKAYRCNIITKDTLSQMYNLRDMGTCYIAKRDLLTAYQYLKRAYVLSIKSKNTKMQASVCAQIAMIYNEQKNFITARKYLQTAIDYSDPTDRSAVLSISSDTYAGLGEMDSAVQCYKGLVGLENIYAQRYGYGGLSDYYVKKGDNKNASYSLRKYKQLIDSVDKITVIEDVAKINALYKSKQKDKENARLQAENRHKTFVIVLFVIALVTIVSGSTYLYRRRKRRYSILSARMNYMKTVMEEIRSKSELNIEENEKKVKALEAEMNSLTEENGSLKADLEERKSAIVSSTAAAIKEMQEEKRHQINICQSDVYQSFTSALNSPHEKMPIDTERWKELERVVNAEYVNFTAKLFSLCTMNAQDYRVCLLLKAGMRVDDISKLTHHSRQSVTSTRIRLYDKTFGTKGEAKKWDEVIASL